MNGICLIEFFFMVLLGEYNLYQLMVDFTRMVILLGSFGALNSPSIGSTLKQEGSLRRRKIFYKVLI